MGKNFHKIRPEHSFVFQDCFFEYKRKKRVYCSKNEQVIHKLFSKCGKLTFSLFPNVENVYFFVETDKEPQKGLRTQFSEGKKSLLYIYISYIILPASDFWTCRCVLFEVNRINTEVIGHEDDVPAQEGFSREGSWIPCQDGYRGRKKSAFRKAR